MTDIETAPTRPLYTPCRSCNGWLRRSDHPHLASGWSRRCPSCHAFDTLAIGRTSTLECSVCHFCLVPPSDRAEEPRDPSLDVHPYYHPRWESDIRLFVDWDRHSGPGPNGGLVAEWGTSTHRADGGPPKRLDQHEDNPPAVREPATRGRQDDLIDACENLADRITSLRKALDALERDAREGTAPWTRCWIRIGLARGAVVLARNLLASSPMNIEYVPRGKRKMADQDDFIGGLEPISPHMSRPRAVHHVRLEDGSEEVLEEREVAYGGFRAAVSAAFNKKATIGRLNPKLGGVRAKGGLPTGLVFNQLAVSPDHSGGGHAPGEDALIDEIDAGAVLDEIKLGVRYESRDGQQVLVDVGKRLDARDLELLRLVVVGDNGERMKLADALAELARQGYPALTLRQGQRKVAAIRRLIADGMTARGIIPPQKPRKAPVKSEDAGEADGREEPRRRQREEERGRDLPEPMDPIVEMGLV